MPHEYRSLSVIVRSPSGAKGDTGEIAEGQYKVEDGYVLLNKFKDSGVAYQAALGDDDDPTAVAKRLLKSWWQAQDVSGGSLQPPKRDCLSLSWRAPDRHAVWLDRTWRK